MANTIKVIRKRTAKSKIDPLSKQRLIWLAGHAVTLIFGTIFSIMYFHKILFFFRYYNWRYLFLIRYSKKRNLERNILKKFIERFLTTIIYKLALIGFFTSGVITLKQDWDGLNPTWYDLLSSENFQYLMITTLWILTPNNSFYRILPFLLLSFMHLRYHDFEFTIPLRPKSTNPTTKIPTVKKDSNSEQSKNTPKETPQSIPKTGSQEDTKEKLNIAATEEEQISLDNYHLLDFISYCEIAVVISLLLDSFLMQDGTSGFCLIIYLGIYWLRLQFSQYAQTAILRVLTKFDRFIPAHYVKYWEETKRFVYHKLKENEKRKEMLTKRS
ncbi:hypothetical protein TBLA_0G01240 [Henningerozyma blattae CBS 6284]|uniref:Uncharacterized protein n=1 Tax=Henningerozyma blattae (strain ATCC 34711 / CBS 6284 / DSM 70876 / NBRC 10599 / NRRL Y-10934 / UCD 77-7) TaxID=1071380 RepID=I2H6R9_HENB6|nr:hypothetical protein TBLA_0G01240 [Tetrapisispora blattae CBS 6284]CCH62071.1 hypothetical protein TBLA_0G01240 [Tetrapisispora blattae CBS 6284]